MKFKIYSIRDVHTGFMSPTLEQNDNVAMRNFAHACKNIGSVMNSSPADFSLMCIGEFDVETGSIISCLPVEICNGTSFV